MTEKELRQLVEQVRCGNLPRRDFIERMLGLGLSLPMAGLMLMEARAAPAQAAFRYKPTRRGGGGLLKLLQSEAPTLLNPHFAAGVKDNFASRIFYEPLAQWDADANLEPVLAAEIPSRANGGLAADGRSVVWRLKKGVIWHDGQPFTADDVVFNWQYAIDPAAATFTAGNYLDLKLEKVDASTVRVVFSKPTPFWPGQYAQVMLVPKHLFAAYSGAKSRDAPNNNKPVGTGAYTFVDFKPGDLLRAAINPHYHQANRPHFDTLELKGGGDTTSAARTVLQTGEYDYAGGLLVDDEVLKRMEAGGKGRVAVPQRQRDHGDLPELRRPGHRSRRRALEPEDAPPAVQRPGRAPRHGTADRPTRHPDLRLRPPGRGDDQFHQQSAALPQPEQQG